GEDHRPHASRRKDQRTVAGVGQAESRGSSGRTLEQSLSQSLYHREHRGTRGKSLCSCPLCSSVTPVVKIYLSQSLPSTMRLMPSFKRATWKLMSSPTFFPLSRR